MKLAVLRKLVKSHLDAIDYSPSYDIGSWGGSKEKEDAQKYRLQLTKLEHDLIVKHDLRPSEYYQLDEIEIGEPQQFSQLIKDYKIMLAEQIKL